MGALLCIGGARATMAAANEQHGVNRTVPQVTPPSELKFSSAPLDAEFLRTGLFAEPLAPVADTTARENQDLARAVIDYRDAVRQAGANDAVAPLLTFLDTHSSSAWKPALQLNLGLIYRQTGHFSKALGIWQAGWTDAQSLSSPKGRDLANAILARLSQLEAYLGRKELLQPLLISVHARPVGGTAAQLLTDSHTGLYDMVYHPDESFRCGPLALERILQYHNAQPSPLAIRVLSQSPSTDHGLSLTEVADISQRAGMNFQAAFRSPGAPVVVPAVAHWTVGHYAAIVDQGADGRYVVEDTTFGEDIRVSPATLEEESSGYFLVPKGPLPKGWRPVSADEGTRVWGRGDTGTNHDNGDTGRGPCSGAGGSGGSGPALAGGCTTATVEMQVVGLELRDTPVGYFPPVGPAVTFYLVYSHRDTQQPTSFSYTNFGAKWTFNWLSYITDNVKNGGDAFLYRRGGGNEPYTFSSPSATTATAGPYSQAVMTRTVNSIDASTSFQLTFPDGSSQRFDQPLGNQFFMTAMSDAAGNTVTLSYDSQMRIVAITDAIGQVSTISYGLASSPLVVTKITDPFGRSASFTYNANGQLSSITDVLGIKSSYTYGQGTDPDFINTLTTPYGSTTFTYGDVSTNASLGSTRFLKTVDPLNRTSYVEYDQNVDAGDSTGGMLNNANLLPTGMIACNQFLQYRNTFIFDANQYALATANGSLNYGLGTVIHWMHILQTTSPDSTSRFQESTKAPLENRVWYNYPAQTSCFFAPVDPSGIVLSGASSQPSAVGRVLDNGSTQLEAFQYNAAGNLTQSTDAVGRQVTFTYAANGIDRLTTSNTTNGSQLLETRTYSSLHLPLTITGTNGATAHLQYNSFGEVTRYTDPLGHSTSISYDGSGHAKTVIGAISSAEYRFTYDAVGRVASSTDPAGSTLHYTYDAADRPITTTYPDGTTSTVQYKLLDRTTSTDRLGQTTHYSFDADREQTSVSDPDGNKTLFGYNLAGFLNFIRDGNGHETNFNLDAENRVTSKRYANGKSQSITYESAVSRIATVADALDQIKAFTYNDDNSTATIGYASTQPTPSVSFTYDPDYPRLLSMTDGNGTTSYTYNPIASSPAIGANQLRSITSPVAGSSGTDSVVLSYDAVNRVTGYTINGVAQTLEFDALGRTTSVSNALGTFAYGYLDGTSRVAEISSTSGPSAAFSYFGPSGDELLQQLNLTTHANGTSLAQFGYTYNSNDEVKSLTVSSPSPQTTSYAYDSASRLVSGLIGAGSTPQYAYTYDHASNLTSISTGGTTNSYSYTGINGIDTGTYNANGSPTVLSGSTYKWDGENRLVRFANATANKSSSFSYDGFGRLVRIVDKVGSGITADHSYFWCGTVRCLAHDNTKNGSPVSTQYFDQGAIVSGTAYYYVKDQLGSVTQLVNASGAISAQYGYDPYGNLTVIGGTLLSDIGYAGYFYHAVSGLNFALFRAYDPAHARWLNRDPIGETGGINLYAYVGGRPVSYVDPSGHLAIGAIVGGLIGAASGALGAYVNCGSATDIIVAGLFGGLTGGLIGLIDPTEVTTIALASGAAGAAGDIIGQKVANNGPINTAEALGAGAGGVLGGLVGGAASLWAAGEFVNLLLPAEEALNNVFGGFIGAAVGGVVTKATTDDAAPAGACKCDR